MPPCCFAVSHRGHLFTVDIRRSGRSKLMRGREKCDDVSVTRAGAGAEGERQGGERGKTHTYAVIYLRICIAMGIRVAASKFQPGSDRRRQMAVVVGFERCNKMRGTKIEIEKRSSRARAGLRLQHGTLNVHGPLKQGTRLTVSR